MAYTDIFDQRNSDYGGSIINTRKDSMARKITDSFFNSPSYYQVSAYTSTTPDTSSSLDSWIMDDSKIKELKQIQLIPDQVLNFGDIIIWNTEHWLTLQVDFQGGIYYRGSIQRCFSSIKWLDSTGEIREAWFTYRSDTPSNFGVQDGRVLIMPNERRHIIIQSNEYTQSIRKDQRLIFDNRAWEVISYEGLTTGIVTLTLEETDIDPTKDNIELRIADYHNKVSDYKISIIHSDISSIYIGNPYQINVQITNRGDLVSVPVAFTSSDESVASIDNNGLMTTHKKGEITITASYGNISDSITLNVLEQVVNNYSVDIIGNSEIRYNATLSYSCIFKNNGFAIDDTSEYWLTGDDGISSTNLVSIVSQDNSNNSCSIKAAKVSGYFRLHVKNNNNLISDYKRIQVKSPLEN